MDKARLKELRDFVLAEISYFVPPDDKQVTEEGRDLLALIDEALARQVPDGDDRTENKMMIYANIRAERARQDAKWGFPQHNSLSEWGNILGEEYGEYCKALNELVFGRTKDPGEMTTELIHVAAVAVGILEHLLMDGGDRA